MALKIDLRALRKQRGLTQEELARELGIWQSHMGYIERGQRTPSLRLAAKISKFFGVPLEEMAGGEDAIPAAADADPQQAATNA